MTIRLAGSIVSGDERVRQQSLMTGRNDVVNSPLTVEIKETTTRVEATC